MKSNGFRYEVPEGRSSWVKTVMFNGESVTVVTLERKSFDLLATSAEEVRKVVQVCFIHVSQSIGAVINELIAVRNKDGSLKTEEADARIWG